jgi:hypothetical protein
MHVPVLWEEGISALILWSCLSDIKFLANSLALCYCDTQLAGLYINHSTWLIKDKACVYNTEMLVG